MGRPKILKGLVTTRRKIAETVRDLRQSRGWTQTELAARLQLSQSRLSEIERGAGSFTAEQFLLLLKLFNVAASHFVTEAADHDLDLHNALARLGAVHLQESARVLPSEQLEDVHHAVREALVDGAPRVVTALAPVFVRNAERLNLTKLYVDLEKTGLERRLAWSVENTLVALDDLGRSGSEHREWTHAANRARVSLQRFLEFISAERQVAATRPLPPDVLDATIRSRRTLDNVQRSSSSISQRWGIVTSLQPEDFVQALRAARATG